MYNKDKIKIRKYESSYKRYVYFIELDKHNFFCFANEDLYNTFYSPLTIYDLSDEDLSLYFPEVNNIEKHEIITNFEHELNTNLVKYLINNKKDDMHDKENIVWLDGFT